MGQAAEVNVQFPGLFGRVMHRQFGAGCRKDAAGIADLAARFGIKRCLVDEYRDLAAAGDEIAVLVNQTPFYAESGGQVGDTGSIFSASGAELAVHDTAKKAGELHVHLGRLTHGSLKEGEAVELRVDGARRRRLRANHSVTHLLHQALRRRLGAHVTQKGSLVAPDRLRFDFSHPRPLSAEDILTVEADVNERVRTNAEVGTRLLTPDRAVAEGALALF